MWIGCPAPPGARSVEASRAIVAQVEAEWTAHLGEHRMTQLRRILTDLREITDPWRDRVIRKSSLRRAGVSDEVRRLRGRYLPIAE